MDQEHTRFSLEALVHLGEFGTLFQLCWGHGESRINRRTRQSPHRHFNGALATFLTHTSSTYHAKAGVLTSSALLSNCTTRDMFQIDGF